MRDLANLPPMIGLQLLTELRSAGIAAGSSDLAPGSLGALPGLAAPSITIWIEQAGDLQKAREILERILRTFDLDGTAGNARAERGPAADQVVGDSLDGPVEGFGGFGDPSPGDVSGGEEG